MLGSLLPGYPGLPWPARLTVSSPASPAHGRARMLQATLPRFPASTFARRRRLAANRLATRRAPLPPARGSRQGVLSPKGGVPRYPSPRGGPFAGHPASHHLFLWHLPRVRQWCVRKYIQRWLVVSQILRWLIAAERRSTMTTESCGVPIRFTAFGTAIMIVCHCAPSAPPPWAGCPAMVLTRMACRWITGIPWHFWKIGRKKKRPLIVTP